MKKYLLSLIFSLSILIGKTQTSNSKLNEFIKEWVGVKYKFGGSTKKGIDCSQFNKRLYLDVYGINLDNICAKQWNQTTRILRNDLIEGDLLFFKSNISPSGWHCGVYIGNDKFVHAANKKEGVKISSLSEPRYNRAFKGGGRIL